jgi:hypothetical protein
MSLFGLFKGKSGADDPDRQDADLRKKLVDYSMKVVRDKDNRIRVEDMLCLSATIVGERCIDATGVFNLRNHDFPPGQRIFSDRANELICGDTGSENLDDVPQHSIVGILRMRLDSKGYTKEDFPNLKNVFQGFAAGAGNKSLWGKVPLSVPTENLPRLLPLRAGFETRDQVDNIFIPIKEDKQRCLRIATESLAELLNMVSKAINPRIALTLTIETINGMAKTASMTAQALAKVNEGNKKMVE